MPHKPRHPHEATAQWAAAVGMAYVLTPFGYILYKFYVYVCILFFDKNRNSRILLVLLFQQSVINIMPHLSISNSSVEVVLLVWPPANVVAPVELSDKPT